MVTTTAGQHWWATELKDSCCANNSWLMGSPETVMLAGQDWRCAWNYRLENISKGRCRGQRMRIVLVSASNNVSSAQTCKHLSTLERKGLPVSCTLQRKEGISIGADMECELSDFEIRHQRTVFMERRVCVRKE